MEEIYIYIPGKNAPKMGLGLAMAVGIALAVSPVYALAPDSLPPQSISYVEVVSPNSLVVAASVSNVVSIPVTDGESVTVGITTNPDEISYNEIDSISHEMSIPEEITEVSEIEVQEVFSLLPQVEAEIEEEKRAEEERIKAEEARKQEELKALVESRKAVLSNEQGGLFAISKPDPNYINRVVNITGNDRVILEALVMGEAGNQGFAGAALVAQCLKDAMVYDGYGSIEEVRRSMGYAGRLDREPNEDVKAAVAYVFDQGGYAVQHRILYFYAFKWSTSGFHESQNFIIEHGGHRVFDRW